VVWRNWRSYSSPNLDSRGWRDSAGARKPKETTCVLGRASNLGSAWFRARKALKLIEVQHFDRDSGIRAERRRLARAVGIL
jgi:hypothetical protein